MTEPELIALAEAWIRYWTATGLAVREQNGWATDQEYDLTFEGNGEDLWQLILLIHDRDKSAAIQQVLSAGPIENLLAKFGERFIDRVEQQAGKIPRSQKSSGESGEVL